MYVGNLKIVHVTDSYVIMITHIMQEEQGTV